MGLFLWVRPEAPGRACPSRVRQRSRRRACLARRSHQRSSRSDVWLARGFSVIARTLERPPLSADDRDVLRTFVATCLDSSSDGIARLSRAVRAGLRIVEVGVDID